MLTIPPLQPGQPSLTLTRFAVGVGQVPSIATAPVTIMMGDDKNQKPIEGAFGTYDPQMFLYAISRLFPGAVNMPFVRAMQS
jgi:hypothetical protein